ncbi:MAG: hypothetical protein QW633_03765 [Candidatus Aenigmatarchaeota archaeon]
MIASGLAAPLLKDYPTFFDVLPLVVVGDRAQVADVVGAIDLAFNLAQLSTKEVELKGVGGVATISGGVSLDTADSKLYLGDNINSTRETLTGNDLDVLGSASTEDNNGVRYDYTQYLTVGGKQLQYAQPDVASGVKDPAYLIKLGTSVSSSAYLLKFWASFSKPFNATLAIGKELKLFGKSFTISSETAGSRLVLFGLSGETEVKAGEKATVTVGDKSYEVEVVGIIDSSKAVIKVNGVSKEVTEGNTYDFAGTSVYVKDVFYYKVPVETGYVVVSIGGERYVFEDGQPVRKGTAGNEVDIQGTLVDLSTDVASLSTLAVYVDAYSASPAIDYIKEGSVWADPVFGVKVAYGGPSVGSTETVTVSPGGTTYYSLAFTDKYGKSGTIYWAYYDGTNEVLADSLGNAIHVLEGESAKLNEYLFATSSIFPHLLKVTSLNVVASPASCKATLRDVLSGSEYKVDVAANTTTLIIDGISYDVACTDGDTNPDTISIKRNGANDIVVYPVLETKYGAKVAFVKPQLVFDNLLNTSWHRLILPSGPVWMRGGGTSSTIDISYDGTTVDKDEATNNTRFTVGGVVYVVGIVAGPDVTLLLDEDQSTSTTDDELRKPALMVIEEKEKDAQFGKVGIFVVSYDNTTDKRLELTLPYAFGVSSVSTSSDKVTHYVTRWGTKVVYDVSGAGVATVTYPDTQVYHLVAVGIDPKWTIGTVTGEKIKTYVTPTTLLARLDSELTDAEKSAYHIVTVGGPVVNGVSADALGETKGTVSDALRAKLENKAIIKVVKSPYAANKYVLVVAGWEKEHTLAAVDAIVKGKLKDIDSDTAFVEGSRIATSVTAG